MPGITATMSSSTPTRRASGRVGVAALLGLLSLLLLPVGATDARAEQQPSLVAAPVGTTAGQSRLVVELRGAGAGQAAPSFSVTVDGTRRPTTVTPLLSDRLTTAVVVDASRDGGPVLQPGLSGVVDFVLGAPAAARTALVADTSPPAVVTPLRSGPAELLNGLSALQPGGDRQTVAALDLAAQQLPPDAETPRLVLLYTAAPDAAGRSAADLGAGLSAAGIVLAVVTTAGDGGPVPPYWSDAAGATGGTAISARGADAVDGFTRLSAALRSRYVLTLPAPARFPAAVTVQVAGSAGPLTAETVLSAPPGADEGGGTVLGTALVVVVGVLVVAAMALAARARGRRAAHDDAHDPDDGPDDVTEHPRIAAPASASVWDVPARPDPVTNRAALLDAMDTAVRAGTPVVLDHDGWTGLGVTTAMIEFAHRNRDDYDVVWWVAAEDLPLVKDRLAELAEALALAGPGDTAGTATDRLRDTLPHADRWLLILDDAPGPDELAPLLPDGPGHVLIGSRDPAWRDQGVTVPVPAMRRSESVALLRTRHPDLSAADADRVAAAVHDVPLALVPAGGTLAETGTSVEEYLRTLAEHAADGDEAAQAVALDLLASDDPPALALLTFVSWLAPQPFPLALLGAHPELLPLPLAQVAREPRDLTDRAATLHRRGLARVGPDHVQVHPALAARLRARTAADGFGGVGWAGSAVRVLRAALTAGPGGPALVSTWRRLLPHVLAVTDPARDLDDTDVAWLLRHAGRHLRSRGEPRSAQALLTDAHDLYRRRLGDDHPDTVASARDLADDAAPPIS